MAPVQRPAGPTVRARVAPGWWGGGPRRVRVAADGAWHLRRAPGGWRATRPDALHIGPGRRWLHLAGPAADGHGRLSATLWAHRMSPDDWRRVCVAAVWRMQRAS